MPQAGSLLVRLGLDSKQYTQGLKNANTRTKSLDSSVKRLRIGLIAMTAATVAVSYKVIQLGKESVKLASALEEMDSKFRVVFKGQVALATTWTKKLVGSFAMSTLEAKKYLASVQDLLVPMGMASAKAAKMSFEVVKLSADLGSFNDLPTAQVMADIQSALVGNFETMKKYGVVLNMTVVQEKALAMGLASTTKELTAGHKAQAAYALMVEGSKAAIGDMARTSQSYANQVKQLGANIQGLKAGMGEALLPVLTEIVKAMNDWIKANSELIVQGVKEWVEGVIGVLKDLKIAYDDIRGFVTGMRADQRKIHQERIAQAEEEIARLEKLKVRWIDYAESVPKMAHKASAAILKINTEMRIQKEVIDLNLASLIALNKERTKKLPKQEPISVIPSIAKVKEELENIDELIETSYINTFKLVERQTMAELKMKKGAWDDQFQYWTDINEKITKKDKVSAKERGEAAKALYKDLKGYEGAYYKESLTLIDAQVERFRAAGLDEAAIAAWTAEEEKKAWRKKALASNSFFAGMKVGFSDMQRAQKTWADHGKTVVDAMQTHWKKAVDTMVAQYMAGEQKKITLAGVTKNFIVDIAGTIAAESYKAAIGKVISSISLAIAEGVSWSAAEGSKKLGVIGALKEIGAYLVVAAGAMVAGKAVANRMAGGGWIESHPGGGIIRQGSGIADDVFLKSTPGVNHWGMGGEFVVNKQATRYHRELLEAINCDRGMMTGGYINRGYAEGSRDWKPVADALAIGGAGSAIHGFIKKGGIYGAIAELITFFATAVPAMFAGKALAPSLVKRLAGGGMIDAKYGFGMPGLPGLPKLPGLPGLPGLPSIPTDPEQIWKEIKELIRIPLKQMAIDLVTPKKYHTDVGPAISIIKDYLKTKIKDISPVPIPFLQEGGRIPSEGLVYAHAGERMLNRDETRAYETSRPIHITLEIGGRQLGTWIYEGTRSGTIQIHKRAIESR